MVVKKVEVVDTVEVGSVCVSVGTECQYESQVLVSGVLCEELTSHGWCHS